MNAMNAINAINDQKNNATTCNQQPNGGGGIGKVTPAHYYEELEELQLESVAGGKEHEEAIFGYRGHSIWEAEWWEKEGEEWEETLETFKENLTEFPSDCQKVELK